MARAHRIANKDGSLYGLRVQCPACEDAHVLAGWTWNGDLERPTFSPSLLVRYHDDDGKQEVTCHSQITDGRILYYPDSTHDLKGQTVDLLEVIVEERTE